MPLTSKLEYGFNYRERSLIDELEAIDQLLRLSPRTFRWCLTAYIRRSQIRFICDESDTTGIGSGAGTGVTTGIYRSYVCAQEPAGNVHPHLAIYRAQANESGRVFVAGNIVDSGCSGHHPGEQWSGETEGCFVTESVEEFAHEFSRLLEFPAMADGTEPLKSAFDEWVHSAQQHQRQGHWVKLLAQVRRYNLTQ